MAADEVAQRRLVAMVSPSLGKLVFALRSEHRELLRLAEKAIKGIATIFQSCCHCPFRHVYASAREETTPLKLQGYAGIAVRSTVARTPGLYGNKNRICNIGEVAGENRRPVQRVR
jgi:hypothetical protein